MLLAELLASSYYLRELSRTSKGTANPVTGEVPTQEEINAALAYLATLPASQTEMLAQIPSDNSPLVTALMEVIGVQATQVATLSGNYNAALTAINARSTQQRLTFDPSIAVNDKLIGGVYLDPEFQLRMPSLLARGDVIVTARLGYADTAVTTALLTNLTTAMRVRSNSDPSGSAVTADSANVVALEVSGSGLTSDIAAATDIYLRCASAESADLRTLCQTLRVDGADRITAGRPYSFVSVDLVRSDLLRIRIVPMAGSMISVSNAGNANNSSGCTLRWTTRIPFTIKSAFVAYASGTLGTWTADVLTQTTPIINLTRQANTI